jgi:hypothetical protein
MAVSKLLAALIAIVVLACSAVPAAAQQPAPRLGMNVDRVLHSLDWSVWNRHTDAVAADGIRLVRSDAFWGWVERTPPQDGVHTYNWLVLDAFAMTLAQRGLQWQPVLGYSAWWSTTGPNGDTHAPPRDNADYAAYVAAFADRYGRGGKFWEEHPELPQLPVTSYEIWNEPNGAWFWLPRPDAARYADMYIRARSAIKREDPAARAIMGGLTPWGATDYVRAMYSARPELRGAVDAVGLHPYARTGAGVYRSVRSMRTTLEELGDGAVPLHLTELGWPTRGTGLDLIVPEAERARLLEETADTLIRSDCGVETIFPYTWMTAQRTPDDYEEWYGLVAPDGTRSPSVEAYRRVVARYASNPPDRARPLYVCKPPPASQDANGNGVPDAVDALPLDARDADRDGKPDHLDTDDDNDRVADASDAFPQNGWESSDTDGDRAGDNFDLDDDNDRLPDVDEARRGTSPADLDTDDDGLADGAERRTHPARRDSDRDGLPDGLERGVARGIPDPPTAVDGTERSRFRRDRDPRTRTLATRRDSDRDGLRDGREDRNRNGRRDSRETRPHARDSDGDRIADGRDPRPLKAGGRRWAARRARR